MAALRVFDLLPKKVLVARSSAREIASAIEQALREGEGSVVLDFEGIEGVTPSFVDEVLGVIQSILDRTNVGLERIVVSHPPTRLSSKFRAIGRGRHLTLAESDQGHWIITPE